MMKKILFLSALVISVNYAHAQEWTRLAGVSSYDFGYAVAVDPFGNSIIGGGTQGAMAGSNAGRYDLFVGKYDPAGNLLWLKQRGTAQRDFVFGVATDGQGNVYATGYTGLGLDGNSGFGNWDIFVMKFGPAGNWLWTRQDGASQDDEGRAIATDLSGNVYITGYVRGNFHGIPRVGTADVFVSKYDPAGTRLWSALFGSPDVDESFGITCDSSGNVYVTGWCSGSIEGNPYMSNGDNYLVKYDTNGVRQWLKQWGTWNKDTGYSLACDAAGNVYLSGYSTGPLYAPPQGNRDYFLAKFDPAGNLLWGREIGTSQHDQGWGVATDADGNAYVAGETGGPLDGNLCQGYLDVFLSKYDPAGTRLWTKQIGTGDTDWADGVAVASNGEVFVGGTTYGSLNGNPNQGLCDAFVMKFVPTATAPLPAVPTAALASPAEVCIGESSQLSATPGSGGDTVEWFVLDCPTTAVPGGESPTVAPSDTTEYGARTKNSATGVVSTWAIVTVTVNTPGLADFDLDCDVDQSDFDLFSDCASASGVPLGAGCATCDFDLDNDVDQSDFAVFQRCYSGEDNLPDADCGI